MRNLTAGKLRHRIGIHSGKQILQENGETATVYNDEPDRYIWAQITPVGGKTDALDDGGEIIETTHTFYVRALSIKDIKPDMYFTYRGQRYDILSYTPYYKEPGWLELSCVLVIERGEPVQTVKEEYDEYY